MLVCLIGQSASGKSTIEKKLCEQDYSRLVSYTTRPARNGEVNGLDYHFIDEEEFSELDRDGFFHEVARYREWFYGISLDGIDLVNETHIAVVTVHGYDELSKHTDDIVAIHIHLEEKERLIRQLNRGDAVDEVIRRVHADREDFKNVESICDYIVHNNNLDEAVSEIVSIINKHEKLSR